MDQRLEKSVMLYPCSPVQEESDAVSGVVVTLADSATVKQLPRGFSDGHWPNVGVVAWKYVLELGTARPSVVQSQ